MTDLETRLREGMRDAVADQSAPPTLMRGVYRRHRRRTGGMIAVTLVAVLAIIAAAIGVADLTGGSGHRTVSPARFPGGGRLLFVNRGELTWLYPDGRTMTVARGYFDASVQGQTLVAERLVGHHGVFDEMSLDGSRRRLLIPAERARGRDDFSPKLSPDGQRVAYMLQILLPHGNVQRRLVVRDLSTGQVSDLGPFSGTFWWQGSSTLLAGTPDVRALVTIDITSSRRTTYLAVTDPAIVAAYDSARPTAGPPAYISADGWRDGPGQGPLALSVSTAVPNMNLRRPAELLYDQGVITQRYAPPTPQQLNASWGTHGLLLFQTGAGDVPGWDTYVATAASSTIAHVLPWGQTGVISNPTGTVIAMQDDSDLAFAAVPQPACSDLGHCEHFAAKFLSGRGRLLAWTN